MTEELKPNTLIIKARRVLAFILAWLWRLSSTILFYVVLLLVITAGIVFFSESAPRWIWQQTQSMVPDLELDGLSGSLATGLSVDRLAWHNASTAVQVEKLALALSYSQLLAGRLVIANVQADSVSAQALKASEPEVFIPPTITLPLLWGLSNAHIKQLHWSAFEAEPLTLDDIKLSARGHGSSITIDQLSLAYSEWKLQLQAELALEQQWPLTASVTIASSTMPSQRISLAGDLSALRAKLRGPAKYPVALDATVNALLPTLPFRGRISWPQWQPPGQDDWRLAPGAMTFAGSTEQGELALDLRANLLKSSSLEWPKNVPRTAHLAGPLRWQSPEGSLKASIDWRGKLGKEPWTIVAQFDQAKTAQTLVNMRLANALISAKGWPDSGLMASIHVPRLQRFQTQIAGALTADAQWRGAWPDGQGKANILLKHVAQYSADKVAQPLLNQAKIKLDGRVEKHNLSLDILADQGALSLQAAGGLALKTLVWEGQLKQAKLAPKQSRWQLNKPVALSLSAKQSHLEKACWKQIDPAFSAWFVCVKADLDPKQWLANLAVQAPKGGGLTANFRRNPTLAEPPLDADIKWQDINLAELPMALPEGLAFAGRSDGEIRASGTLDKPVLTGQWSLGANLSWPRYGLEWPELIVDGRLAGQRATWTANVKDSSNGQLTITGEATWQPDIRVKTQISGGAMAFAYAPWVQGKVSPTLDIAWLDEQLTINGEVVVNKADITLKSLAAGAPKPSSDVVIVRNRSGREIALSDTPNGLPLNLRVRVVLGEGITLTGYGLDAGLRGQLLLTQTPNTALAANGEISLKPDAKFAAYGQRLTIEQGRLLFAGPLTTPDIRLTASREIDGIKVGVNVIGQAPKPAITLTSDSPMSQDEILSYLVLGRSLGNKQETSAADKQALALSAALNLTGKTGAIGMLGERLGLSDLTIGTQGDSDSTEVAVSGRLSEKVWLSIGRGVFQPSQSVTVRYQINRRLSLEALSALESAITLFYSWRF